MNFCPKCEFMVYTKTSDDESKKLINYCKNCFWSGDYITELDENSDKISVYSKKYSDDYVSHSIYTNSNIVHDNTLPRINNIKCIHADCVSNIPEQHTLTIQLDNTVSKEEEIINNISSIDIKNECKEFLKETLQHASPTQTILQILEKNIVKIAKNKCIVKSLSKIDYDSLLTKNKTTYNNVSITFTPFTKKKNEIIFIKYNKLELKYMYICTNCKSSWKN